MKKFHQGKVVSIKNLTMNLNGNTTKPDIQVHGGMKVMYGDIGYHKYNKKTHEKSYTQLRWPCNNWSQCTHSTRMDGCSFLVPIDYIG